MDTITIKKAHGQQVNIEHSRGTVDLYGFDNGPTTVIATAIRVATIEVTVKEPTAEDRSFNIDENVMIHMKTDQGDRISFVIAGPDVLEKLQSQVCIAQYDSMIGDGFET